MYKSHCATVNYPGQSYRALDSYYGVMPGQVGTVTSSNGETLSIPVPSFVPPMNMQTVPRNHVSYIGTPSDLQHGLSADQLSSGYFDVSNAYPRACSTFEKRSCDGNVKPSPSGPHVHMMANVGDACGGGMDGAATCMSGLTCVGESIGNPGTCMISSHVKPMPPPAPIPSPPAPHHAGGIGDMCTTGVMGSCQQGLVCVHQDSSDAGMAGARGRCMMPFPHSGDN